MGVSRMEELDETMRIWRSVLDGLTDDLHIEPGTITPSDSISDHEWSLARRQTIRQLAKGIRGVIGDRWVDYAWASPDPGFVNLKKGTAVINETDITLKGSDPALLTPPSEADDNGLPADVPPLSTTAA